jgi:hypothetical protein
MDTTASASKISDDARRLLGTLSTQAGDIEAAFSHHYQQTLHSLRQAQGDDALETLENTLRSLRAARRFLLAPETEAEPAIMATATESSEPTAAAQQPPLQRDQPASASADADAGNNRRIDTMHRLLSLTAVIMFVMLSASSGWFVSHLQQQIVQLQDISEAQTQQLVRMQDIHLGERRQWLAQQDLQQRQIIRQQDAIEQQHSQYIALQQQLSQRAQQLVALEASSRQQQQHIQHLNRVSDQLISSLCDDSASLSPAVGSHMRADYLQRCASSWRLAAQ